MLKIFAFFTDIIRQNVDTTIRKNVTSGKLREKTMWACKVQLQQGVYVVLDISTLTFLNDQYEDG